MLSTIGACSVSILFIYIIKKIDDHLCMKREENRNLKIDEEDDDEL